MIKVKVGDRFQHKLNRDIYQVVLVKQGSVVLQLKGSPNRLWFGLEGIELFFETMERRKS